ncbi:MAG: type II secretion system protein GspM [Thiolinea sp.]
MKTWFMALSERERHLVLLATFVLGSVLIWLLGWRPLQAYKSDLERDLKLTLEDREFIRAAQEQVQALEQAQQDQRVFDTETSVQLLANPLLKRYQLDKDGVMVRSEAKSKDGVSLRLENASFDNLVSFIGEMEHAHNIKVTSMALIPTATTGLTGAQLTLER